MTGTRRVRGGREVHAASINFAPTSRVTVPQVTDWHLVADHELDKISLSESSVAGAIGFTTLGAALSALPSGFKALHNILNDRVVSSEQLVSLVVVLCCAVSAIICLTFWVIYMARNRGALKDIRSRPTRNGIAAKGE